MAADVQEIGTIDQFRVVAVKGDTSYPTGGYTLTGMIGPNKLVIPAGGTAGHDVAYNRSTNKLQFYVATTGAEVAAAVDLSAVTAYVLVA